MASTNDKEEENLAGYSKVNKVVKADTKDDKLCVVQEGVDVLAATNDNKSEEYLEDDAEFIQAIARQTEDFIIETLDKIRKDLRVQAQRQAQKQSDLERRVLELEKEMKDKDERIANLSALCPCQGNIVAALQLAVDTLRQPPEALVLSALDLPPADNVVEVYASTSTIDDSVSHVDSSALPLASSTPKSTSRKRKHVEVTPSRAIDDVYDLPEATRLLIEPYLTPSRFASKDMLSNLQRAFVHHKCVVMTQEKQSLSQELVEKVITEGRELRLWLADWSPPGTDNFHKYLFNKMKNMRKGLNRGKLLEERKRTLHGRYSELGSLSVDDIECTLRSLDE